MLFRSSALRDPALLAEAERTQRYVDFIDAEQTRKATLSVVAVTPEQKKKILAIIASAEKK